MPTPPRRPRGSLTLLQVRFAVRPPRLEPAVAPRLHILVQLLYGGGVEQHLPRRHPLVGAAVQRRVFERVAGVGLPVLAQHPPQIGGVGEHGMHGVLAVAAEAVHVEPLPSLIDRIGYEEAVARAAGATASSYPIRSIRDGSGSTCTASAATARTPCIPCSPTPPICGGC